MSRITIHNDFTQWAEYLARYFGHELIIYDNNGDHMWGSPAVLKRDISELRTAQEVRPVYKDINLTCAYLDATDLTPRERQILDTLIPFIESQLEDEGA